MLVWAEAKQIIWPIATGEKILAVPVLVLNRVSVYLGGGVTIVGHVTAVSVVYATTYPSDRSGGGLC